MMSVIHISFLSLCHGFMKNCLRERVDCMLKKRALLLKILQKKMGTEALHQQMEANSS